MSIRFALLAGSAAIAMSVVGAAQAAVVYYPDGPYDASNPATYYPDGTPGEYTPYSSTTATLCLSGSSCGGSPAGALFTGSPSSGIYYSNAQVNYEDQIYSNFSMSANLYTALEGSGGGAQVVFTAQQLGGALADVYGITINADPAAYALLAGNTYTFSYSVTDPTWAAENDYIAQAWGSNNSTVVSTDLVETLVVSANNAGNYSLSTTGTSAGVDLPDGSITMTVTDTFTVPSGGANSDFSAFTNDFDHAIPEPGTIAMLLAGLIGLAGARQYRRAR